MKPRRAGARNTERFNWNSTVMALLGLEQAFSFDEHFAAAGFVRVP